MKARTIVVIIAVSVCLAPTASAHAQSNDRRLEVAALADLLRLSEFNATSAGIGGRVSFDVTEWATLEGEVSFFPHDNISGRESVTSQGSFRTVSLRTRTDALFGVKAGVRGQRFGAFLKARPGITRLADKGTECVGPGCAVVLMLLFRPTYRTELAFDFGGGAEFYATPRTVARVELGDTMIRHRSFAPPCPAAECTSHNFSSRFGLGFRF